MQCQWQHLTSFLIVSSLFFIFHTLTHPSTHPPPLNLVRFNSSIFAVEYPSYGPAEGDACEETVNDNVRTAFEFLRDTLGYPVQNIVIMGYSIGTGPTIHLAADLCENGTPPAAIVTIAAFLSICDIVRDLKRSLIVYFADAIANRWNSGERIKKVTCPVLLLHGLLDEVIPYEHSEKLFAACPSLGKRLRLVPDADHIHFEEPVDTVQPIATFLKENLRPNNNVEIGPIPPENFACPVSVLNREVLAKGHGLGADGQEMRSCSVVESMFSWVFDVSNALVEGGSVVASGSSAIASTSLSVVTETFGNSFASVEDLKQETDVEEEKKVAAENSEPKHRHITMPSPEKGSPLYNGNRGSNSNSYPSSSSKQGGSATDATVKIDMHILSSYFEALNRQDLLAVVGFLDQDIAVRFTDDSRRNWSSSSVAFEKFFAMFKDMPDLKVAYNVLDVKHGKSFEKMK